jgi:hypothetical protein
MVIVMNITKEVPIEITIVTIKITTVTIQKEEK